MTDFVTRLEAELHSAAVQRERSGRVRGVALPRLRVALRDVPAAALAVVLLALAAVGAAIMLAASPERPVETGIPTTLRGVWQAPPEELRLYPRGSDRCVKLGVGPASACYTLGESASAVAREPVSTSAARRRLRRQSASVTRSLPRCQARAPIARLCAMRCVGGSNSQTT